MARRHHAPPLLRQPGGQQHRQQQYAVGPHRRGEPAASVPRRRSPLATSANATSPSSIAGMVSMPDSARNSSGPHAPTHRASMRARAASTRRSPRAPATAASTPHPIAARIPPRCRLSRARPATTARATAGWSRRHFARRRTVPTVRARKMARECRVDPRVVQRQPQREARVARQVRLSTARTTPPALRRKAVTQRGHTRERHSGPLRPTASPRPGHPPRDDSSPC